MSLKLLSNIEPILIVFCYIFSFYIIGPITSSMVIALPLIVVLLSKTRWTCFLKEFQNPYLGKIVLFQCVLMGVGVLYSSLHLTFDVSYVKVVFGQFVHLFFGFFVVFYLKKKFQFDALKIENVIIQVFLLQSVIQIIASVMPSFAHAIVYFSRANDLQEAYGGGVRGLALASGVGWSLALSYGLVYIIFVKRFLLSKIRIKDVLIGMLLLFGTFFAGRTGFVGALLGILFFFLSNQRSYGVKFGMVLKVLCGVLLFCLLFYFLFPGLSTHLINNVFPFAFEPFYKLYYNDEFSTGSTDRLSEMWSVPISFKEVLTGTGYFTDPHTGAYYKHVDVGILRNLFYWGIGGYILIIIYQLVLIHPIRYTKYCGTSRWDMLVYKSLIILYFVLLEFKAMTIGFNKMTFSIVFLLSYFYFSDYRKQSV